MGQAAEQAEPSEQAVSRAEKQGKQYQKKLALANEIDDVLRSSLADPPTLAELAQRFYVSRTKLCCDYREVTGKSVGERLSELRIQEAKLLLENSSKSVGQISKMVGYRFQSSFATAFSRETRRTPQQWRASHRTAGRRTGLTDEKRPNRERKG